MTEDGRRLSTWKENIIRPAPQSVCGNTVPLRLPATANGSLCANRIAGARCRSGHLLSRRYIPAPFPSHLRTGEHTPGRQTFGYPLQARHLYPFRRLHLPDLTSGRDPTGSAPSGHLHRQWHKPLCPLPSNDFHKIMPE